MNCQAISVGATEDIVSHFEVFRDNLLWNMWDEYRWIMEYV